MLILYLFLFYFPFVTYGDPMLCTEVSTSYSLTIYNNNFPNVTASAIITLLQPNSTNIRYFRVSNVTGRDLTQNIPMNSLCYDSEALYKCNDNLMNSYDFMLDESIFYVDLVAYYNNYFVSIFYGYINNGSISNPDGSFLTPDKPCFVDNSENSYASTNQTTCCTNFIPAPIVVPSNATKCKRFRSRTNLLNDDYTINGTTSMNYTLQENQIITQGDYSLSGDYPYPEYFFHLEGKSCSSINNTNLSCNISLPPGDSKTSIIIDFRAGNTEITTGISVPQVGFFIIRNNQTLMYEGIPFTSTNDCMYFTHKKEDSNDKNSNSEFCCKEFE